MFVYAGQPDKADVVVLSYAVATGGGSSPGVELDGTKTNGHRVPSTSHPSSISIICPTLLKMGSPAQSTYGKPSLFAGKPNGDTFPFTSFQYTMHSLTDRSQETLVKIEDDALREDLQYGRGASQTDWVQGRRLGEE
ncbi:hypothetical protein NEOLEDRAFT_1242015 [Neolentinus lepideus HHB14362 ss-1]|uniref:Uncharacterized protein n=1 Tax=Neolentinus lepideus HHB14362 ss-1 TaxID=1314782 RepID=A0A165SJT4_9AGAM|nr:hypothetical protein NEOLEDRAFT_1242015 [Neolentinus lepideus HHB14362 ss-1]